MYLVLSAAVERVVVDSGTARVGGVVGGDCRQY